MGIRMLINSSLYKICAHKDWCYDTALGKHYPAFHFLVIFGNEGINWDAHGVDKVEYNTATYGHQN